MLTGGLYYDLEAEMFSPQMCRCQGEFGMFPPLNHLYSSDPIKTFKEFFGDPD